MTDAPIIHIVDDDESFRTAVARLLRSCGYEVSLYDSAEQFLQLSHGSNLGCILLDVKMSGLTGPELQSRLAATGYPLPIVFLTGHGDVPTSVRAIKAGAEDFLSKPIAKSTLTEAIERALLKGKETREKRLRLEALRQLVGSLSPRENQVFGLMVRGRLNKQIAYELGTTESTIKAQRRAVMEKLKVRSLAEAVSIAERLGLLGIGHSADLPPENSGRHCP